MRTRIWSNILPVWPSVSPVVLSDCDIGEWRSPSQPRRQPSCVRNRRSRFGRVPRFANGLASTIVSGLLNPTVKERVHIERYLRFNRL
jgi:hypothetical protein